MVAIHTIGRKKMKVDDTDTTNRNSDLFLIKLTILVIIPPIDLPIDPPIAI